MTDHTQLRQAALAATPGPWHWDSDPVKNDPFNRIRYQVTALGKTVTKIYHSSYEGGPTNAQDDAKFIAAANPQAVIELLDENERLRKDAERYRWLTLNAYVGIAPHPKPHEVWCLRLPNHDNCNNLDAAIDAAMVK